MRVYQWYANDTDPTGFGSETLLLALEFLRSERFFIAFAGFWLWKYIVHNRIFLPPSSLIFIATPPPSNAALGLNCLTWPTAAPLMCFMFWRQPFYLPVTITAHNFLDDICDSFFVCSSFKINFLFRSRNSSVVERSFHENIRSRL